MWGIFCIQIFLNLIILDKDYNYDILSINITLLRWLGKVIPTIVPLLHFPNINSQHVHI